MRNARLITVAAGGLVGLLMSVPPTAAQIPVTDVGAIGQLVQSVQNGLNQLHELQATYNEVTQVYNQVASTYQMLTRFTNVGGMAQSLAQPFVQNPSAGWANGNIPSMITGTSSFAGLTTNLGALADQFSRMNNVFMATGSDFAGQQLNQRSTALSNLLGVAVNNLQSLQARVGGLQELERQLNSASDLQTVNAINAKINMERNYIATQQAQAINVQTAAQLQLAAVQAAAEQKQRKDAEELFNNTAPLGDE
jgi:hypothetical protein